MSQAREHLLATPNDQGFKQLEVTMLFADLRGFTAISSEYPADIVIDMLNRFFATMSDVVMNHGGTVDKFMGDSIMATFGAPQSSGNDVQQAIVCAVQMQIAMDAINQTNLTMNLPSLYMGIGINTGVVMAGNLGSPRHQEYTVIGDSVNLASRIESFSLRGQILLGESTYHAARDFIKTGEPINIFAKGKPAPVEVREVLAIPSLQLQVPNRDMRRSQRVKVQLPFTFQTISNKIVSSEIHHGTIKDMGYHGIRALSTSPLKAFDDIKLGLDLTLIGYKAADIYAKVLRVSEHEGVYQAAIEFTSITVQNELNIRQFVQMLLQGCEKASS